MDPETSAIIAVIGAAISLGSCAAAWLSMRLQTRSIDFNNCLEVMKQLGEAQRRVRDAGDDEGEWRFEILELLNLMEALAKLINRKRIGPVASEHTEQFLVEAWAWLKSDQSQFELIKRSITGVDTFGELTRFADARRAMVEAHADAYRQLKQ